MSVTSMPVRWGTVAQAVKEFGVGESTLRRWISDGRVRFERVGPRLLRVDLDSLAYGGKFGSQLTAALATLDHSDVEALAHVVEKISAATNGNAFAFEFVWRTIGGVARAQAKATARA